MSLRDFIKQMDEQKESLHVNDEVSTRFEISQIMKNFDHESPIDREQESLPTNV